jgi:hypothetical protein
VSTSGKSFDPSTVSRATWIALGGAVVLFISVFISWYKISIAGFSASRSGWDSVDTAKLVALLALIAIAAIVIELFVPTVTLPLPASLIVIAAGGLAVLLVLLKILDKPASQLSLAWGIFVALIAAAVTAYGGYAKMNEA